MKKNLFKLMACVLATVSLGSLVGCGETPSESQQPSTPAVNSKYEGVTPVETTPINVWATAAEEAVISAVVNEWNASVEAKYRFQVTYTAIAEGDCGATLSKDPTVEGAPALFLCADDHIAGLQSKSIVAELKGARREKIEANNSAVAVAGVTQQDKVWGYPVTSDNGYFLWYNKSLVSADKIDSLEELLAHAKSTGKQVLMDLANGWYANSFIMSPQACGVDSLKWKTVNGQNVYDTTWDNAAGAKVSEYIANLLTPYVTDGTLVGGSNPEIINGFEKGTMLAAVSGTWMEKDLITAIGAENLAADKLPEYHIDGQAYQMASFGGSKVYCINKTRPAVEQKTAAALGELLTTKEAQLKRFEIRQSIPCNNEAILDARYTENVSVGAAAFAKQSAYACVQSQTAEDRYWDIGKAIGQAYTDSNLDGMTWSEFLKKQMDTLRNPAV